jgi:hypothetical protein
VTGFTWDVDIDGTNVAVLVPETGVIDYGRSSVWDQPGLPTAVIDLISVDADATIADLWPEFSLGGGVGASGYADAYADAYAGPSSRVLLGADVAVTAVTASGYADAYADAYAGVTLPRFTGIIQAIDYTTDAIRLTCLPRSESWSRIEVGGTDDVTPIPEETDIARVQRLCDEARVSIEIHGAAGPTLVAVPVNTTATPLATQLQAIANDARGLLFTDRAGVTHYHTQHSALLTAGEGSALDLPAAATLTGPLAMSLELGLVRTRVVVEYGNTDEVTGQRPTVTVEDADQAAEYGWRTYRATVQLRDEAAATAYAVAVLAALGPTWTMPNVTTAIRKLTDSQTAAVAGQELGEWVHVPTLLAGSPLEEYAAPILGYREDLSGKDWTITHHLAAHHVTLN